MTNISSNQPSFMLQRSAAKKLTRSRYAPAKNEKLVTLKKVKSVSQHFPGDKVSENSPGAGTVLLCAAGKNR